LETAILDERQVLSAAGGTNVLIMNAAFELVLNPKLCFDFLEIADMKLGCEGPSAAHAIRRPRLGTCSPIEVKAELRGTLKDVEELAERQEQEREDHGHRVELCEKAIMEAMKKTRGNREKETRR
jgi:hypothetical protein